MTLQTQALAGALGALLILSSPAMAQARAQTAPQGAPQPGGGMGGPRTLADVPTFADRLFGRLDANQDAAITGDELAVLSRGPAGSMGGGRLRTAISQSDASNDGRISKDELTAGMQRMFTRMDANHDGTLSGDELPRPPTPPAAPSMPMPSAEPEPMPDMPGG
ncbi:hypothetical protein GGQ87_002864 [Brevundimonas alba]|uniref:EF-hand domain-containing protein n=1 Tax=Brevundimonas alba TaxID=74314 RepID=A0A7X5YMU8_9CAUL|nr:hypothetical protein [Brevundimonas alba]NJC42569.1 hypothetical protein [Brevundimonas alba]